MKIINFFRDGDESSTSLEYKGITKFVPLIVCGSFYLITILLFIFGPFDWNINNEFDLYSFLFLTVIFLILGYYVGTKLKYKKKKIKFNSNHIMYVCFVIYMINFILTCYATTGKFYPDIIRGIFDSGTAYRISHSSLGTLEVILYYVGIIVSPFISFILPLLFIYHKSLNKISKILGYVCLLLNLCLGIAQGVINSYAIMAFQLFMFVLIYVFSNLKKIKKRNIILSLSFIVILLSSFFLYYKTIMTNRLLKDASGDEITIQHNDDVDDDKIVDINVIEEKKNSENTEKEIDDMLSNSSEYISQTKIKDKYFYSFLPDSVKSGLNHLVSYITHGYKGLSFALKKNFTSSYGLGFSDFFRHNFLKLIGKSNDEKNIYKRTYMYKILDDGWETGAVWSTFFIFPASDIGFPLTILLVFFIGMLFSVLWRDAIESRNIFASVLFVNFCMIICFFCANNGYFQNGASFVTLCVIFVVWLLTRFLCKEEA